MKSYLFFLAIILGPTMAFGQVGINADNSTPDPSAMLDIRSSDKGILIPRLSQSQIQAIASPADGLQVYCTADSKIYIYVGSLGLWKEVAYGPGTITVPFSCGNPITINHIEGAVAPVTKTATYGTVTNISGELNLCWITSNLGADHQASAVNDNTEPSAGWYWQFNRKQGYKHDGSTRTPNTTWINSISETSDWVTENDPCNIELGTTWRIPTYTEWYDADNTGGWTTWTGPWGSGLKLHAAGFLYNNDGTLTGRGSNSDYWSSTKNSTTNGWNLGFDIGYSAMDYNNKAYGFTVRCIREY